MQKIILLLLLGAATALQAAPAPSKQEPINKSATAAAKPNLLTQNRSEQALKEHLLNREKWMPYPAYNDRAAWAALLGDNAQKLIARGEKQLNYKWKLSVATDYLAYERTGERNIMQNPQTANNNALSDLVLAELAEGKGRFIDQIINGVFLQCERTSWVLSAHLPRQSTHRSLPDWREQIIDLGSGEIGGFLAWTYYFLHQEFDKADPAISLRLKAELQKRILTPYMANDREWWMAFYLKEGAIVNNWNPWCNFNVLQCNLLLEDDTDKLAQSVWRSMLSVDKFINYVKSDGACEEGPAYWGHAAGKLFDYLELLRTATGGYVDLFDQQQIRAMGEYISRSYVGNGWVINFADASAQFTDNISPLIYRYGKALNSGEMQHFAATLAQKRAWTISGGTDIYRSLAALQIDGELRATTPMHNTPAATWYVQTQFCYLKTGAWTLGAKGGHNAESHNHNDVGTCVLYLDETPILIDAGVGTYTKQTFSDERYQIWTMQSQYHNLPTINGVQQHEGRNYKGTLVNYNEKQQQITFDIAGAYPAEAGVHSWLRSYRLSGSGLDITDKFSIDKPQTPNVLNFLLWGEVDITTAGNVKISVNGKKAVLKYDADKFVASLDSIALTDPRLTKVWGTEIFRLRLTSKNITDKKYEIKIRKEQ